ncbi:transposase [Streptomyces parvus]
MDALDCSLATVDGSHIRAPKGAPRQDEAQSTGAGRAASTGHHLITDATGIPLAVTLTSGNRNDVTQLIPLLRSVPPVRGKRGRLRRRPAVVLGDRGYDHDRHRRLVRTLGMKPLIARRGTEHGSGLGTQRWVVEPPSPTCAGSAACGSAGRSATTSTKPSSRGDTHSSAGDACHSRSEPSLSRSSHSLTEGERSGNWLTFVPSSREVTLGSGVKSSASPSPHAARRHPTPGSRPQPVIP